jgi:hypothetical protein
MFVGSHIIINQINMMGVTSCSQEFDKCYGPGWQCVVGTNFGSFVTHARGNFIYFGLEKLAFLLFKGAPF